MEGPMKGMTRHANAGTREFSRDRSGLPIAEHSEILELSNGDELDLGIAPVAKRLDDATLRMLAYNGSIPGPTLRVRQGSEIVVNVTDDGDVDPTVHWHGLRLENRFGGVPHQTQAPIAVGSSFTYRVQFPDPGLFWSSRISARTTCWRWGCTATSSWFRPNPTTGRRSTPKLCSRWTTSWWRAARSPHSAAP